MATWAIVLLVLFVAAASFVAGVVYAIYRRIEAEGAEGDDGEDDEEDDEDEDEDEERFGADTDAHHVVTRALHHGVIVTIVDDGSVFLWGISDGHIMDARDSYGRLDTPEEVDRVAQQLGRHVVDHLTSSGPWISKS